MPSKSFFHYILSLFLLLSLVACFGGVKKTGKVKKYRQGQVITKKGFYQVGAISAGWKEIKLKKALVAFYNDALNSTMATGSFCDQAYNDSPLKSLTQHLFPGLQDPKILKEEPIRLARRGGLRTLVSARLDGLPVTLDLVVVKKDWCLFDFYLVAPPDRYAAALKDFEKFFRGFYYQGQDL